MCPRIFWGAPPQLGEKAKDNQHAGAVDSQATSKVTAPTEGKRRMRMVDRK
jgi:hypothetical protein